MKFEFFSRQIFEKSSNIKFHENPLSGRRVVPYGRTDMTKLIVLFRNSAKTPLKITETNKILWLWYWNLSELRSFIPVYSSE